jgi:CelD/BcsL family acetyltransferase involved in cellulose biosynthesis
MQFELVTSQAGLAELGPAWQGLTDEAVTAHQFFQDWRWVNAWWAHLGASGHYELAVLVATDADRVVMIWPWVINRVRGLKILEPLGGLMSCFDDALVAPSAESARALREGWQFLRRQVNADAIEIRATHEQAHVARLLAEVGGEPIHEERAPYIDLQAYAGFDAYMASRSKKMRQNQRRTAKYLGQQGALRASGDDRELSAEAAIDISLDFKAQWLEARGLSGKTMLTEQARAFLKQACRDYSQPSAPAKLCVSSVYLDDKPVSIGIGFRYKGCHYEYLGSFDYRLEHYGPGRLRMEYGIRDSFEQGLDAYHMLTPDTAFKKIWTEEAATVRHYIVALSAYGRLYRDLYIRRLRPRLKKVYHALPPALRASVVPARLWG